MNKRLLPEYREFVYKGEPAPFSPGTLAVVIFCTVLLIVATFTKIEIAHFWPTQINGLLTIGIKKYQIVPQVPVVLLTSAILGARFGSVVVILYLLVGFFLWPVFGFGGGVEYVKSYFFGYILGFFVANIFAGNILSYRYGLKNIIYASIIGVLSIHICGLLYSLILELFEFSAYKPGFDLAFTQILYDIILSMAAIMLVKPVKYILWIAMKNETRKTSAKIQKHKKGSLE